MRHCFLTCMCMLLLLLAVAVAVMWIRSHQRPDFIHYTSKQQWHFSLISGHGAIDLLYISHWPQEPELWRGRYSKSVYYGTRYSKRILGFGVGVGSNGGRFVNIPHWFVVTLCAVPSLVWLCRCGSRRTTLRRARGLCVHCGYDLRASKEHCPECGAQIPSSYHELSPEKADGRSTIKHKRRV